MQSTPRQTFGDEAFAPQDVAIFHQTRQKFDSDRATILPDIQDVLQRAQTIVDVWCGTGRLYDLIRHTNDTAHYIGIDQSQHMIDFAATHIDDARADLLCVDMVDGLRAMEHESADMIIAMKSFHHLRRGRERRLLIQHAYRVLRYGGVLLLVNRNLRQLRYRPAIMRAIMRSVLTAGWHDWRDISIPRRKPSSASTVASTVTTAQNDQTDDKKNNTSSPTSADSNKKSPRSSLTYTRHYHLCGRREMKQLLDDAGFVCDTQYFTTRRGEDAILPGRTDRRRWSRNLVTIGRKSVVVG